MTKTRRNQCLGKRRVGLVVLAFLALAVGSLGPASAVPGAPFDAWAIYDGGTLGYVNIPHASALNPTTAITLEAWINADLISTTCFSIAGKGFSDNYWLGFCGKRIRSYVGGRSVDTNQLDLPAGTWVHVAMTSDGTTRKHYIDGSLVTSTAELGTLAPNSKDFRIGRDADWSVQFDGAIDEVRLWDRALSIQEIRDYRNFAIRREMTGLIAVWDFGPNDVFDYHDGIIVGDVFGLAIPPGGCSSSTDTICVLGRFTISATWTTSGDSGQAVVVSPASDDTGLFWFFAKDNWELMVKMIDACSFNGRFWVFIAASTDQGYEITVRDSLTGETRVYSKPVGPPAAAITDTAALDVCSPF